MIDDPRVVDEHIKKLLPGLQRFGRFDIVAIIKDLRAERDNAAKFAQKMSRAYLRVEDECEELRQRIQELESGRTEIEASFLGEFGRLQAIEVQYDALREAVRFFVGQTKGTTIDRQLEGYASFQQLKELTESGGPVTKNDMARSEASHGPSAIGQDRADPCQNTPHNQPAPSSFVGQLLVQDGVPYREPTDSSYRLGETITHDGNFYDPLTDSPPDIPYRLAWDASEFCPQCEGDGCGICGESGKIPDGLYECFRVGDCECVTRDEKGFIIRSNLNCPTCHGDGGRYELRPVDKGVDE